MIRNIIFDMGNVLKYFNPDRYIRYFGYEGEDYALLMREVFKSPEWVALDRGTLLAKDAPAKICPRLPAHLHEAVGKLVNDWWKIEFVPVPGMADVVRELKENGYGIYLLSNASSELHNYFHRIPGSEYFDGLLVSGDELIVKPDPRIYHILYERFNLDPAECWFIDDSSANIEAGIYTGMGGTVFFNDVARLRHDLHQAGINISE